MKRIIAFTIAILLLLSASALAEGKLKATSKNLIEFDADNRAYFFAKIENVGDADVGVGSGKLVGFSADDEIIVSESYVHASPSNIMLKPGDSVYVSSYIYESALKDNDVVDYKFSLETYKNPTEYIIVPCEARYELLSEYENYAYVTFTNVSEEIKYGVHITVVLTDEQGNLIYVNTDSSSSIALHPGSTMTVKISIGNDFVKYYKAHDIKIANIEAIVRYMVD